MKLFFTFCLAIFLPAITFAQSNYHEGYVLKNNGDTLKGFIDYREWYNKSPVSIAFKINKGDKQEFNFTPATIKKFEINGMETYISYIGGVSMNKTDLNNLPPDIDTVKEQDTIFLKQETPAGTLHFMAIAIILKQDIL